MNPTARARLLLVIALLVAVAPGCGRGDTAKRSGTAPPLAAAPGFDPVARTIRVGVLTPLSGPVQVIGEPLTDGMRVFFAGVNALGGIGGRYKVELVVEDTVYDNPTSVQKYQKIKDGVTTFIVVGTPVTNALLPQLQADGVVALAGSRDAKWIREPNLLPYGAPYQVEFLNGANYFLNDAGGRGKTICLVAVEGPYGDAGVDALDAAARAERFTVKTTARYRATDTDFTAQVTQLRGAGCEAVFLTALPANTGPILGTAARLGFTPMWLGQSPTWSTAFAKSDELRPILERQFLLLHEGAEWGDRATPGMRQMLDDMERFKPGQQPDIAFVAGYVQGMTLRALLEKAVELGDLSRPGMLNALPKLGRVSFDGLSGDWDHGAPGDRNPSRQTTVFRFNPAKPGGLEAVKQNFTSPAARSFRFDP